MSEPLDALSLASNGLVDETGGDTIYVNVPGAELEVEIYTAEIEVEIDG